MRVGAGQRSKEELGYTAVLAARVSAAGEEEEPRGALTERWSGEARKGELSVFSVFAAADGPGRVCGELLERATLQTAKLKGNGLVPVPRSVG